MLIGYARVSTNEQNIEMQIEALNKAGCERIYQDIISGIIEERKGLDLMISQLRSGDTVVVWKLDRLSRSIKQLIQLINDFKTNGVSFKSLTESIDTSTPGGALVFHIFGALAEFERELISERTKAGLLNAKARGRFGGRPEKLDNNKKKLIREAHNSNNYTIPEICEIFGITKTTLYRYLKEE